MKVLLIETPCDQLDNDKIDPPIGLLSIATHLKRNDIAVRLLDLSGTNPSEWSSFIPAGYDVVGFRTLCVSYKDTLTIKSLVEQKNPRVISVAGGPQASSLPEQVAEDFDFVVVGEGEVEFLNLVKMWNSGTFNDKKIFYAQPIDPNSLDFPDYSMVKIQEYSRKLMGEKALAVLASRGCGHNCAYCNSSVFGGKSAYRPLSAVTLRRQLNHLYSITGVRHFKFIDDNFPGVTPLQRMQEIRDSFANSGYTYRCYLRVDQSTPDVIQLLRESGCVHVTFGIESGDDQILQSMRRGYSSNQIMSGVNAAFEAGLIVRVCFMVGFPPFESNATIQNTLQIINRLKFHEYLVYPFLPYPGCDVAKNPHRYGVQSIDHDHSRFLQIGKGRRSGFVFSTQAYGPLEIRGWISQINKRLGKVSKWIDESDS